MLRHRAMGFALVLLVFSTLPAPPALAQPSGKQPNYVVTRVLDARTFDVRGVGRVRLLGVAPPQYQPYADEAWREAGEYCQANLVGKRVKLETDLQKSNNEGQALVYLYLEDGTFLNVELVRTGYATVASNALIHLRKFKAAEEEARENHRGIWSEGKAFQSPPAAAPAKPVSPSAVVEPPPARAIVSTTPQSEPAPVAQVPPDPSSAGPLPAQVAPAGAPAAAPVSTAAAPAPEPPTSPAPAAPTLLPDGRPVESVRAVQGIFPGARLFIEEMDNDLDGFIRAEMVKKKIPLVIVLDVEQADLVMTGSASGTEKRSWHEGWLTAEKDKNTGNVMIFNKAEKVMLWASEAGDRSVWWGALKRGGPRKVADRLVNNLKKAIKKQE